MQTIRPNQVLQMGSDFGRSYRGTIPHPRSGGMNAFERLVIVKLLNLVNPKRIFEFGTYFGETTKLILENLDFAEEADRLIYTLDLDILDGVAFESYDEELAKSVLGRQRAFEGVNNSDRVVQLLTDSKRYTPPSSLRGSFQFVLIDANHALDYVRNDTEIAFELLDLDSPHVVIWDDYGTNEFPEMTQFLNNLSIQRSRIYAIAETNLCMLLSDHFEIPISQRGPSFQEF